MELIKVNWICLTSSNDIQCGNMDIGHSPTRQRTSLASTYEKTERNILGHEKQAP